MNEKTKGLPLFVRVQNAIKAFTVEDTFLAFVFGMMMGGFVLFLVVIVAVQTPSQSQRRLDAIENCQARGYTRAECFEIVIGGE